MSRFVFVLLIGVSTPAFAQQSILGVEGEGTQSQSVELLGGSVSVTVDSAGSLSLGRGEPDAAAGVGVSVNDLNIVSVGSPTGGGSTNSPQAPSAQPGGQVGGGVPEAVQGNGGNTTSVGTIQGKTVMGGANASQPSPTESGNGCATVHPQAGVLERALNRGGEIWLRSTSCTPEGTGAGDLIAAFPALTDAVLAQGLATEDAVAITISDEVVIIDFAQQR